MRLNIEKIIVGERVRKDLGDMDALAASIDKLGLLSPITVACNTDRTEWRLVAGYRRLEACKKLEWDEIEAVRFDPGDLYDPANERLAERDENTCRKDFTPSEAVAMGRAIEDAIREEAKRRQHDQGERGKEGGRGNKKNPSSESDKGLGQRTDERVAAAAGMGKTAYREAAAVVEAAKANPEKYQPLVEQMDATGKVHPAFVEMKKLQEPKPEPLEEREEAESVSLQNAWVFAGELERKKFCRRFAADLKKLFAECGLT